MKLVYRILLHMSWALSLLLAAWAVLFYFTMIDEINDEVDDSLENYAEVLVKRNLAGRELPAAFSGSNNGYFLHDVSAEYAAARPHMVYSDEEIFIPEKDEEEPARVLRMIFRDREGSYKELTVMTPTIEKDDLQEAILWWIVYLYLFLLLTILLINILVLHRTLRPLYALLRWLDGYRVGGKNAPLANDTKIAEFRRLNEAAIRNAERAEVLFDRQKQFIGNASHEMQTPLAVCRNRLEMLVGDGSALSEEQLGEIMKVQRTLDYLVRLNRSLLLLSKIENGQFPETEQVDFNALVRRTAEDMSEIYAGRGMRLSLREEGRLGPHEFVAGGQSGHEPAEKRLCPRRCGRRSDGDRFRGSSERLQQRCGRCARCGPYLRTLLSGGQKGGFDGAGPFDRRCRVPSLRFADRICVYK